MFAFLQNLRDRSFALMMKLVWQTPIDQKNPLRMFLIRQTRILVLALQNALQNKIVMLAPALTFFSVLSIVPAATLALGIARGFGLERYLEQQLQVALAGREEVLNWIMELTDAFFRQVDSGVMAIAGLSVLIYTILMLLANVEKIFNQIWQVRHGRTWLRRLSDYFAMVIVGPLFLIAAGAVTVFLSTQIELLDGSPFGTLLIILLRVTSYLLIWIIFTLLYLVMPNTRVHLYPALVSGIVAGTAFQLVQWAYLTFQIGAASLGAIYGSFAALPLLLIWMQISWSLVLFGAEITHAAQNIELYRFGLEPKMISPYRRKVLSLYILYLLLKNFKESSSSLTAEQVSKQLNVPVLLVQSILNNLKEVKLLKLGPAEAGHEGLKAYQPALDVQAVTVAMALKQLELHGSDEITAEPSPALDALTDTFEKMSRLIDESEANRLLIEI